MTAATYDGVQSETENEHTPVTGLGRLSALLLAGALVLLKLWEDRKSVV